MTSIIVFPDAEQLAIDAASDSGRFGDGFPIGTGIPDPRPDAFFVIRRAGGPQETLVTENAILLLESYDALESGAIARLNIMRGVLKAQDGPLFGYAEVGGPINLPDPRTSQIRYTQSISLRTRGAVSA